MRKTRWLRILVSLGITATTLASSGMHPSLSYQSASGGKVSTNQKHERFAVLIGVNSYVVQSLDTLRAPANDVGLMKQLLIEKYGFPEDRESPEAQKHIRFLIGRQATRGAIATLIQTQLIDKARNYPGATVVFYFSGHGSITADGKHRTIVPSDSRTQGVYDILDDDINTWLEELRQHTNDITLILDSCHSGAWTKGIDDNLVVKEVPADTRPQPSRTARPSASVAAKDLGNGFLDRNDAYSAIYGCLRYETSLEGGFSKPGGGTIRFSFLTYYLVQTLTLTPYITYREAVEITSGPFSSKYNQHPQAEGNVGRPIFGSTGFHEDPFVRITNGPIRHKSFQIDGGTSVGIRTGTYLAIYKPQARHLVGETDKLANARVTEANEFSSTAELPSSPQNPIPADAKVAVVTPFFGSEPLKVNLTANSPGTSLSQDDSDFVSTIAANLKDSLLVKILTSSGGADHNQVSWDLGLQKGCLNTNSKSLTDVGTCKGGEVSVLYLVTPNSDKPLYGFTTPPISDASDKLSDLIQQRAKQENLRVLVNTRSPLNDAIKLTIIRVDKGYDHDNHPIVLKEEIMPVSQEGSLRMHVGQDFRLRVENVSTNTDLDIAIIALGTSGKIKLITPRNTGTTVPKGQGFTTSYLTIGPPLGLESYKVIAYTVPKDGESSPNFGLLEQAGADVKDLKAKDFDSPLSQLVNQTATGQAKDPGTSDLNLASWSTTRLDVVVIE